MLLRCTQLAAPFKAWWSIRLANCSLAFVLITAFGLLLEMAGSAAYYGRLGRSLRRLLFSLCHSFLKQDSVTSILALGVFHGLFIARYPDGHQVQNVMHEIFSNSIFKNENKHINQQYVKLSPGFWLFPSVLNAITGLVDDLQEGCTEVWPSQNDCKTRRTPNTRSSNRQRHVYLKIRINKERELQ